jgi:ABC-2 type transport system permease protein
MNAYIKYFNLSIQSQLQFRANFIFSFFTGFLFDYVKVAIWYAIMLFQVNRLQPVVIEDTIKYMVLASSFSLLFKAFGQGEISQKIINGTIERDMLYPVSVLGLHFSQGMGAVCVEFFRTSCVTFTILTLIYRLKWNFHIISFLGMILLLLMGLIIQFLFLIAIDLSAFWMTESVSLQGLWDAVYKFFGGFLMPLWFLPDNLQYILDFLPFRNMVNIPVTCFIRGYNAGQILSACLNSFVWIIILTLLVRVLWHFGVRKLNVNGG